MSSYSFKLAVALLFWSSAILGVIKTFEALILSSSDDLDSGDLASDEVLLMSLLLKTSSLQEHLTLGELSSDVSRFLYFVDSIALICSSRTYTLNRH